MMERLATAEGKAFGELCGRLERSMFDAHPVSIASVASVSPHTGVYTLYLDDVHVYSGKAITKSGLRGRLRTHLNKLARADLVDRVTVRMVEASPPLATGFELYLIERHATPWNGSGFGSNAHGSGRPNQRTSIWVETYIRGNSQ